MNRPQKFSRRDPFPRLPFACEEEEGLPSFSTSIAVFFAVVLLTMILCEVM